MRDIKFRVWDKDRKKMYYLLENRYSFGTCEEDRAVSWEDVFADKHEELLPLQYTGLTDKNGNEIYEGDIIRWYPQKTKNHIDNIVEYIGNKFSLGDWYEDDYPDTEKYCKIIGNIYDNPELIGGKS